MRLTRQLAPGIWRLAQILLMCASAWCCIAAFWLVGFVLFAGCALVEGAIWFFTFPVRAAQFLARQLLPRGEK